MGGCNILSSAAIWMSLSNPVRQSSIANVVIGDGSTPGPSIHLIFSDFILGQKRCQIDIFCFRCFVMFCSYRTVVVGSFVYRRVLGA